MKKLGIFALLGCLLTVGGVYAEWIYGQASAGSVSESIIPQMAGVGESSKKGTIGISTTGLTIVIDEDPVEQYKPVLDIQGSVTVKFTPSAGADQDVKDNGIKMAWTLTQSADWTFDPNFGSNPTTPIFTLDSAKCENIMLNDGTATKSTTIEASVFADAISLNLTSKLDTKAKYENFKSYLNKQNSVFTLTVFEYVGA
jgi:hypothetical protein